MKWVLYSLLVVALGYAGFTALRASLATPERARLDRLWQLEVPRPGAARFAFLKEHVPDVVSQVTCSCCGNKLIQCYEGACPPSCGPCNEQGKKAYDMFLHGKSIEAIQAYMAKHHPVSPGARSMTGM